MTRNKTLVVGSRGFIGARLMKELEADEIDLKIGSDVRHGIDKKYKTIVFLACDQADTREAYRYNYSMYRVLDGYRKRYPTTRLIFISSAAVYDRLGKYAQSKILGEAYAKRFENHIILRLSNVYGHGDGHGAPDRFLRGSRIINGDGEQVRDIVPVETVVGEIIDFVNCDLTGTRNVSTGLGTTVNQMFKLFGTGEPKYDERADVGVKSSILEPGWVEWW